MKKNRVKELWREGKVAVGTWMVLGSPLVAEILANLGFDWLVIDTEHGAIDIGTTASIIQAIRTTDTVPMVRVPWNDPALIKRALDAGAYGLVIPMVNSREEAIAAVQATRYPPLGIRSYGGPRARLYGGADYFAHANEEIALIVQIEHIDAVNHIDEILSVEGVDGYFIGPNDLAVSMGLGPGMEQPDPRHGEAINRVIESGKKHGVPGGIHVGNAEEVNTRIAQGCLFMGLGSDERHLRASASAEMDKVNKDRKAG
jgi:4-hydroxy-2-oxoheptanedioate aldolase